LYTRFIVTNLKVRNARALYEDVYCRRGQAENHIKSWKTHLAADRTSCTKATANQLRLFLHAGAYWLMWGLRVSMPKRSVWRVAQFDTLRLHLIKVAAPPATHSVEQNACANYGAIRGVTPSRASDIEPDQCLKRIIASITYPNVTKLITTEVL
jgi:hypothetical protein